jgi:hypothetical protein
MRDYPAFGVGGLFGIVLAFLKRVTDGEEMGTGAAMKDDMLTLRGRSTRGKRCISLKACDVVWVYTTSPFPTVARAYVAIVSELEGGANHILTSLLRLPTFQSHYIHRQATNVDSFCLEFNTAVRSPIPHSLLPTSLSTARSQPPVVDRSSKATARTEQKYWVGVTM